MGYVIAAIIVLLLVAGFVTFFMLQATRRSHPAGPDSSPAGDTTEHSGDQREGHTVTDTESARAGGPEDHRPQVGDPGPEARQPASERLANRPR